MIKLGVIISVIVVAAILLVTYCSGGSNETSQTTSPHVTNHTAPAPNGTAQANQEPQQAPPEEPPHPRLRKSFWNFLLPTGSTHYAYPRWSGRGIAERMGFAGTEPDKPWPKRERERIIDDEPNNETSPSSQSPYTITVVPRAPRCPRDNRREYTVVVSPPRCSRHSYLGSDGRCHCESGGLEVDGFCQLSREEQTINYYRNHPEAGRMYTSRYAW